MQRHDLSGWNDRLDHADGLILKEQAVVGGSSDEGVEMIGPSGLHRSGIRHEADYKGRLHRIIAMDKW